MKPTNEAMNQFWTGVANRKELMRERLAAALSFSEKIKILEKLRDRDRAIAASGLSRNASTDATENRTTTMERYAVPSAARSRYFASLRSG